MIGPFAHVMYSIDDTRMNGPEKTQGNCTRIGLLSPKLPAAPTFGLLSAFALATPSALPAIPAMSSTFFPS
jgi:hypothetical protein